MNNAKNASESNLAEASPIRRPPKSETEADFLNRQAREAQDAIKVTLREMGSDLARCADPRGWAREYPWATLGAAVASGVLAGSALMPSPGQSMRDKLNELKEELSRAKAAEDIPPASQDNLPPHAQPAQPAPAAQPRKSSLLGKLMSGPLMDLAKVALTSSLGAAVSAKTSPIGSGSSQGSS